MLELRPTCEHCNVALPPDSRAARICSYECTFCAHCAETLLLFLDTQVGSAAEKLYVKLGWTKAGEIPRYAASPDGTLHTTAYFWKEIA